MRSIGITKHMDQSGRFKIPRELLSSYNLKPGSIIRIYQKEKSMFIEAAFHNCIFCNSQINIHKFENQYICSNCIYSIKDLIKLN